MLVYLLPAWEFLNFAVIIRSQVWTLERHSSNALPVELVTWWMTSLVSFCFRFVWLYLCKCLVSLLPMPAGWCFISGLITAATSSAIGAFLIDNFKIPYLSKTLGKRKAWHLIGTMVGAIAIPLYFSSCFLCQSDQGQWQQMIYIPVLNTILSFSFGLMEISHLLIIPAIAKDQSEAVELNACRYISFFYYYSLSNIKLKFLL